MDQMRYKEPQEHPVIPEASRASPEATKRWIDDALRHSIKEFYDDPAFWMPYEGDEFTSVDVRRAVASMHRACVERGIDFVEHVMQECTPWEIYRINCLMSDTPVLEYSAWINQPKAPSHV